MQLQIDDIVYFLVCGSAGKHLGASCESMGQVLLY